MCQCLSVWCEPLGLREPLGPREPLGLLEPLGLCEPLGLREPVGLLIIIVLTVYWRFLRGKIL